MDTNPNPGNGGDETPQPSAPQQNINLNSDEDSFSVPVRRETPPEVTPPTPPTPAPEPVTTGEAPAASTEAPVPDAPEAPATESTPVVGVPFMDAPSGGPVVNGTPTPVPAASSATGAPKRHLAKVALVVVGALVVLGGAASAAYVGYIIPNKPDNVLKTAVENTLREPDISTVSSFETDPTSSEGGLAMKIDAKTASNLDKKTADVVMNVTVSGVTLPLEARLVDQNLYVKAGDLSTISSLVDSFMPGAGTTVKSLSDSLSNQWIEIDSTLLKQAGATCVLNTSWSLTNTDIQYLENQYKSNQFVTIKSSASDTIDGKSAEKFVLAVNDNKLAGYAKSLSQLSVVKNLQKCGNSKDTTPDTSSLADGDTTPLTLWVDKSTKRIIKLSSASTAQDNKKSHFQGTLTSSLSYGAVSVTAPTGAKPALQVWSEIQSKLSGSSDLAGSLLSASASSSSIDAKSRDAERQADIQSLQTQMEAFFAQYGYYPSLTDINSATWRSKNMKSLDASALQDPQGSSQQLAASPAAKVFAYRVTDTSGKSCEASDKSCANYTLTATLESGGTYAKSSLN